MKAFHGFLFDADNTLFDFNRAERGALAETLAAHGVSTYPRDAYPRDAYPRDAYPREVHRRYHAINDELWKEFEAGSIAQNGLRTIRFARLLSWLYDVAPSARDCLGAERSARRRRLASALSAHYLQALGRKGWLLPFARKVLIRLAARAPLVLLTNGIPEVQRGRLSASGLTGYFRAVVISGEVGLAKPDPRIFALALERLAVPAAMVLCVGDSPSSDIRGGHDAGLATCWYSRTRAEYPPEEPPPTYRIRDLRELLAFPIRPGAGGPAALR